MKKIRFPACQDPMLSKFSPSRRISTINLSHQKGKCCWSSFAAMFSSTCPGTATDATYLLDIPTFLEEIGLALHFVLSYHLAALCLIKQQTDFLFAMNNFAKLIHAWPSI
ncbi:uncharacterized protein LOC132614732 isoform X2 [Lycium barbarum]|uniref:uncharacterized protein LOC132614732 isoform X2 n=1 Tax=Lycium barbarum TaxID=112863 RepID=UPI00293E0E1D|nr:uncharacterized protein LOC132614732 isoform X2 [Lycium barbarum]